MNFGIAHGRYILDKNANPVPEPDLLTWGRFMEDRHSRRLLLTKLEWCHISTVFLGLDHQFGYGPPILWETMVFGGRLDGDQMRYATREQAIAGHFRMVDECRRARRKFFARLRRRKLKNGSKNFA